MTGARGAFTPLPLGAIAPSGWLEEQLLIQADGLTGHLDEFWPDVRDSGWIGGRAEGWERGPYWLDGLVPLAHLLDGEAPQTRPLRDKVHQWISYILLHQQPDGWLGPETPGGDYKPHDPWPVFVFLKALTQYHEATGDKLAVPAMQACLRGLSAQLDREPLSDWGRFRWPDLVASLLWLHDRTNQPWTLELARKVMGQGYDWGAHFRDFRWTGKSTTWGHETHVVNTAMALKAAAIRYRLTGDEGEREAARAALETLDRFHGQATGLFTGDEHLAGLSPSQGTELCAVVEMMYSLEWLLATFGEAAWADRLERVAYNALPATVSPDGWTHQYVQQANQVVCRVSDERVYTNNGPDANLFGLEPNYGCCTANLHQGWPKLVSHLWMLADGPGLAAVVYGPCTVKTIIRGVPVTIEERTDYPFRESIEFRIRSDRPVEFPLLVRVPGWTMGASVRLPGAEPMDLEPGRFHEIRREWRGDETVTLHLPVKPEWVRRPSGTRSLVRGPLVFAIAVKEDWVQLRGDPPAPDFELHPTSPWAWAVEVDDAAPESSVRFTSRPVGRAPFTPAGAPVRATVRARAVPGWGLERNAAAPPPSSVPADGPTEEVVMLPYGAARLRVTEFPATSP